LALTKEQDYTIARESRNALADVMAKLPYDPKDEAVYNELRNKTNNFINGLGDNTALEDKVLDVDQFTKDFQTKYGGYHLVDAYTKMKAQEAELDKAYADGKIVDPEYLAYQKKNLRDNYKGIQRDQETGAFLPVKVPSAQYTPYVDIGKDVMDMMQGWKASSVYEEVLDANGKPTGKLKVNKSIPGYLNYTEGTEITREELQDAAVAYVNSRPDALAYLQDRARYLSTKLPATAETVADILSPDASKQLFGVEDPSITEIQTAIDEGKIDPTNIIQNALYAREFNNAIKLPIEKNAFKDVKNVNLEDKLLLKALDAQVDMAKARAQTLELNAQSNATVAVHKFTTLQQMNPADIKVMNEEKAKLIEQRKAKQAELNDYRRSLAKDKSTATPERLRAFEEELFSLDSQIESLHTQEENINRTANKVLEGYTENIKSLYKEFIDGHKETIAQGGPSYPLDNAPTEEEFINAFRDAYVKGDRAALDELTSVANPQTGVLFIPSPTGVTRPYIMDNTVSTGSPNVRRKLREIYDKIVDEKGEFSKQDLTRDLSYITVEGDTTKDSLRTYNNFTKDLQNNLTNDFEQYMVGDVQLPQYLAEVYNIDNMADYIDWTNTTITPALERDRKGGQFYNISLAFTEKGKDKGKLKNVFGVNPRLKVNATYGGADKDLRDKRVQDVLIRAFADIQNDVMSSADIAMLKEAGQLYLNTDPSGRALDALNLYVLPAGEEAKWNVDGQDLKIKAFSSGTNDLMDTDFIIETKDGSTDMVLVYDNKGEMDWVSKNEYDADEAKAKSGSGEQSYRRVIFETPNDIKKVFGANLLENRYKERQQQRQQMQGVQNFSNPYFDYIQAGFEAKTSNDIQTTEYSSYRRSLRTSYPTSQSIGLKNNKGTIDYFTSNVPAEDLVDLREQVGNDKIWSNNRYPYINKTALPFAKGIIDNYGVLVTGGFRGQTTHDNLTNADKDSPHKYGFSLDLEDNEEGNKLFSDLSSNPNLMQQYNISRLLKHDGHIHIEFNNSII
jgi:hypothetical protein